MWKCLARDLSHQGTLGSYWANISELGARRGTLGQLSKQVHPPPPDRCSPPKLWARAPCLEHTVHSTIWGMDTQGRGARSPSRMSQSTIVRPCWKQARGEVEWGHMSPEEAGTQEEGGIEGSLSGRENRIKKQNSEFLNSPPTLKINVRKWVWTEA